MNAHFHPTLRRAVAAMVLIAAGVVPAGAAPADAWTSVRTAVERGQLGEANALFELQQRADDARAQELRRWAAQFGPSGC